MPASPADGDRYAHQVARALDDLEAALLRLLAGLLGKDTTTDARTWQAERLAELQWLKMRAQRATAAELPAIEQAIRDAVLDAYNHGTASATADLQERLAAVEAAVGEPSGRTAAVLYPTVGGGTTYAYGTGSMAHPQLEAAGLENVFGDVDERVFEVTLEELLGRDPDVVVLNEPEG